MLRAIGKRITYANVIASLALFLALGGGAVYAASHKANKIGTGKPHSSFKRLIPSVFRKTT